MSYQDVQEMHIITYIQGNSKLLYRIHVYHYKLKFKLQIYLNEKSVLHKSNDKNITHTKQGGTGYKEKRCQLNYKYFTNEIIYI